MGAEAARHREANYSWLLRGWVLGIAGFVLIVIGTRNHLAAILGVGLALACGFLACYALAWVELIKMRRAISNALGIPIDWRRHPPPPRTAERYRAWCDKYGVQPYPFRIHGGPERPDVNHGTD